MVQSYRVRLGRAILAACILFGAPLVLGQVSAENEDEIDPDEQFTEVGVRFTPGMARAMGRMWSEEVLVKRYELDKAKTEAASEAIARRLMKLAHTDERAGQELAEYTFSKMFEMMANSREGGPPGIPTDLAQGAAQRLLPFMPAIREMVDGTIQDVRPMLPLKGQLKFTGEVTMAKMALDAFEKTLHKWSEGEVDPFGDPFRSEDREVKKDEDGQTPALKSALRSAQALADRGPGADWDRYVEEAKKYYDFDPSQAVTADSLLRDFKQRALAAVGGAGQWHARIYRNRLWWSMAMHMPGRWNNPLRTFLERDYDKAQEPVTELGEALKERIDAIATQAQRDAAERRIEAALAEKGLRFDDAGGSVAAPAGAPTAAAAAQPAGQEAAQ